MCIKSALQDELIAVSMQGPLLKWDDVKAKRTGKEETHTRTYNWVAYSIYSQRNRLTPRNSKIHYYIPESVFTI